MRAQTLIIAAALAAVSMLGISPAMACHHDGGGKCEEHECCDHKECPKDGAGEHECGSDGQCDHHDETKKVALSSIDQAEVKLAVQTVMGMENRKAEAGLTKEARKQLDAESAKLAGAIRERGKVNYAQVGGDSTKKSCCKGGSCCKKKSGLLASANLYDGATRSVEGGCKKSRQ